jgi:hypothetical protein
LARSQRHVIRLPAVIKLIRSAPNRRLDIRSIKCPPNPQRLFLPLRKLAALNVLHHLLALYCLILSARRRLLLLRTMRSSDLMPANPPSAAQALFGHLKSGVRDVVQQRWRNESIASAMYPRPKPPAKNPYIDGMTETEWSDARMAMRGLRRKR